MRYDVRLSDRAAKDIDRLDRQTQLRIMGRLEQIAESPYEPRFSSLLSNQGVPRKSRVGRLAVILSRGGRKSNRQRGDRREARSSLSPDLKLGGVAREEQVFWATAARIFGGPRLLIAPLMALRLK